MNTISIEILLLVILIASQIHEAEAVKRYAFIANSNRPSSLMATKPIASQTNHVPLRSQYLRYDSGGRWVSRVIT